MNGIKLPIIPKKVSDPLTPLIFLRSGPAIEVLEKEIELGDIAADTQEIVGSIIFFNEGSQPLQIRRIYGPCACLAGYSGDKLLEPGEGGEIQVLKNLC